MPKPISNEDIDRFIGIVDDALRHTETGGIDQAMEMVPGRDQWLRLQAVYAEIHDIVLRNDEASGPNIRQLQRALTKRSVLDPTIELYRDIIGRLMHGTSNDKRFVDFQERGAWVRAVQLINRLPMGTLSPILGLERETAVATAVKQLRDRGFGIDPHGEGFLYRDGELERVCTALHTLVREIGGHRLLYGLLSFVRQNVPMKRGRYLIARRSRPLSGGDVTPSLPVAYLLNVALRHLGESGMSGDVGAKAEAAFVLATDIVASLDVEHYYVLTPMFQTHETIPGYLQEVVVGDHVFAPKQITPDDALSIIRGVFSRIDGLTMRARLGWGPEEGYQLAEQTFARISAERINAVITAATLHEFGLSQDTLDAMLKYFAHRREEINVAYVTPLDAEKSNAWGKPFVGLPDGSLMITSTPMAAAGFYEAIAAGARDVFGITADQLIGDAIEDTVSAALISKNVVPSITSGKYKVGSAVHECDLVIESDNVLILIELKKKALKATSSAGNIATALSDLCLSALKAQLQLGKHEVRLREKGKIEFLDGRVVEWRDRRIERISTSLLDWGGTQDRVFLQRVAANLVGGKVNSNGLTAEELKSVNAILAVLGEQVRSLEQLGVKAKEQFHNWWFLSVPQLLFALSGVTGVDEFYENLRLIRPIHTGKMDFYADLCHMRRARDPLTGEKHG
jgi:hypothetical protein